MGDYGRLLDSANGLELYGGFFRIFGLGNGCLGRDAVAWNHSPWRRAYELPASVVFSGETVFGDQFGCDRSSGAIFMMSCEGGRLEQLPFGTVTEVVQALASGERPSRSDIEMVKTTQRMGLHASRDHHLAFALPLACGGRPEAENLEVFEATARLTPLGQLIEQSRAVSDGTPIISFRG